MRLDVGVDARERVERLLRAVSMPLADCDNDASMPPPACDGAPVPSR